jgi:hypothetical protein
MTLRRYASLSKLMESLKPMISGSWFLLGVWVEDLSSFRFLSIESKGREEVCSHYEVHRSALIQTPVVPRDMSIEACALQERHICKALQAMRSHSMARRSLSRSRPEISYETVALRSLDCAPRDDLLLKNGDCRKSKRNRASHNIGRGIWQWSYPDVVCIQCMERYITWYMACEMSRQLSWREAEVSTRLG